MRNKRYLLVTVLAVLPFFALAQPTGFLGALNSLELKVSAVPSHRIRNKVVGDEVISRMKLLNNTYGVTYSRVLSRQFEMAAGYEFARVNFSSHNKWFDSEPWITYINNGYRELVDDASGFFQGGYLAFHIYRFGSLAPIGKYVGFSVNYGSLSVKQGEEFMIGMKGDQLKSGFFSTTSELFAPMTLAFAEPVKITTVDFRLRIGRNYPLNDWLSLTAGMSAPVLSAFSGDQGWYYSIGLRDSRYFDSETELYRSYPMRSVRAYRRLQVDLALRFLF